MNITHIQENIENNDEFDYLVVTNKDAKDDTSAKQQSLSIITNQIEDSTPHYVLGYN